MVDYAKCPKGTNYKEDCNTCFCDPQTGSSGCTEIQCFSAQGIITQKYLFPVF